MTITFGLPVAWRASFTAFSVASEPELRKMKLSRPFQKVKNPFLKNMKTNLGHMRKQILDQLKRCSAIANANLSMQC